ncbi:MAG: nitroreductase family protein [Bradymonadales bacterium]|nr:nitroreductase family protein [Bradymonadales bacterium]
MSESMSALEAIYARRSIRRFTDRQVSPELVEELLKAAMAAPTARNSKPWHFVVVQDRSLLDELVRLHPYGEMLSEAPLAVLVVADLQINTDLWVQDCSAATENILVAATALGLGSCWLGMYPRAERTGPIGKLLHVPDRMEIVSLLAIGYPGETKPARTQYDPARVHREGW